MGDFLLLESFKRAVYRIGAIELTGKRLPICKYTMKKKAEALLLDAG